MSRRAAREADRPAARRRGAAPKSGEPAGANPSRLRLGLIIAASALVFVLLATGSVFAGIVSGRNSENNVPPPPVSTSPTRVVPASAVQPTVIPTCSLDALATAPSLMQLVGSVVDTATGNPLYTAGVTTAQRPASVLKVLTAAAAISALSPTFQITTSVDGSTTPGTIVLVGQGDATLSAGSGSVYAGASSLGSLAASAFTAYTNANPGVPITHVVLDSSYWDPTDNWDPTWSRSLQTGGYLSEVTALQVDGDRQNPKAQVSPRSTDPVSAAGKAFVAALAAQPGGPNASDVTVSTGQADSGAAVLASVQSQPVSVLVKQMLLQNDDTLAEMLARIISVHENLGGGSSSIQQAITTALAKYGIDTSGLTIEDGSGESDESDLPTLFVSKFMSLVSQKANGLQYVAAALPVAGKTGGLAGRFTGANAGVAGKITGMSGSMSVAYTLTGYLTAADGTGESFTFFAEGTGITAAANGALDSLAAAVYQCGKNITSN